MKFRSIIIALMVVLLVPALIGCSNLQALDNKLDAVEDSIEDKVDAAEDKIENSIEGSLQNSTSQAVPSQSQSAQNDDTSEIISQEEAKNIALNHAGLKESDTANLWVDFENDNGVREYDVDFDCNGYEYNYEINAETGEIISFDKDID